MRFNTIRIYFNHYFYLFVIFINHHHSRLTLKSYFALCSILLRFYLYLGGLGRIFHFLKKARGFDRVKSRNCRNWLKRRRILAVAVSVFKPVPGRQDQWPLCTLPTPPCHCHSHLPECSDRYTDCFATFLPFLPQLLHEKIYKLNLAPNHFLLWSVRVLTPGVPVSMCQSVIPECQCEAVRQMLAMWAMTRVVSVVSCWSHATLSPVTSGHQWWDTVTTVNHCACLLIL